MIVLQWLSCLSTGLSGKSSAPKLPYFKLLYRRDRFKLDPLAGSQVFWRRAFDGGDVEEYIRAATVGPNEDEPPAAIEPFDDPGLHFKPAN
jgi:hypothetical protein